ncbi:MAG: CaiB/BaiF CoA-transferase family protein [Dehalococcoidales bacterium]|nr:CaiB/BaiF CoA-transferase family protein [Dehalococcoidales bacterium]
MSQDLLQNVKILDLARNAPGAFCTMTLGDLGAEIIKVETPQHGKPITGSGVSPLPDAKGEKKAAYDALNRNKKSIAIDLKLGKGRDIFYKLVGQADVIVEGFRPGASARLKIDYDSLRAVNPGIVYCSITGYGQDGPYRDLPGHDINYISVAGALSMIGYPDRPPAIPMNLIGDYAGGALYAVIGILAGLLAKRTSGEGRYLDIAMTDGAMALLSRLGNEYFRDGAVPGRGQDRWNGGTPSYNSYQTRDGKYISIGCLEPVFWENLCTALELKELIPLQFTGGDKAAEVTATLKATFLTRTRDEWFAFLKDKNICIAPVYDFDEAINDPQIVHRKLVTEISHPKLGKVRQLALPIKISGTAWQVKSTAPFLGQHTDIILKGLGYQTGEIKALREAGTIQ